MKPIAFSCHESPEMPPERIAVQILDLARWPEFEGDGILSGIRSSAFESRMPEVVGTRIRVTSTDGSTHVEEVIDREPGRRIGLRMGAFSPPLSRLAAGFDETWEFEATGGATGVVRSFELHPEVGHHAPAAVADLNPAEAGHRPAPASDARGADNGGLMNGDPAGRRGSS